MATTQLSVTATPGKSHSFVSKAAAAGSPRGSDLFTYLSTIAVPGKRQTFSAKVPPSSPRGPELFTTLSVMALPGVRLTFTAKGEAIVEIVPTPPPTAPSGGGMPSGAVYAATDPRIRKDIIRDDRELMEFITTLVQSGILDN